MRQAFVPGPPARVTSQASFRGTLLQLVQESLSRRSTGSIEVRDGCHSSVALCFDDLDRMTVLIKTDIIHSGEWLDEILGSRSLEEDPIIMWDRCSSNAVTACSYIDVACLQHARQGFKNIEDNLPTQVRPILDGFKRLFFNDSQTVEMSHSRRLEYHQGNSRALFDHIVDRCRAVLDDRGRPFVPGFR